VKKIALFDPLSVSVIDSRNRESKRLNAERVANLTSGELSQSKIGAYLFTHSASSGRCHLFLGTRLRRQFSHRNSVANKTSVFVIGHKK
jgi:hypothetical protein